MMRKVAAFEPRRKGRYGDQLQARQNQSMGPSTAVSKLRIATISCKSGANEPRTIPLKGTESLRRR